MSDPRLETFAEFLNRLDQHRAAPSAAGRYDEAGQLLGELVALLEEYGVGELVAHRAETAGGGHGADLEARGCAIRGGAARAFLDLRGLIPPPLADLVAGELLRANAGEPPLLPDGRTPPRKAPGPLAIDARGRLILRAYFEGSRDGRAWLRHAEAAMAAAVLCPPSTDTLKAWGRELVPSAAKDRAKRLGNLARLRREPDADDAVWLAEILRLDLTMVELARVAFAPV